MVSDRLTKLLDKTTHDLIVAVRLSSGYRLTPKVIEHLRAVLDIGLKSALQLGSENPGYRPFGSQVPPFEMADEDAEDTSPGNPYGQEHVRRRSERP